MLRRFAIGWIMRRIFDRVDEDGSGLALHRWITRVFMCNSEVRYASCATRVFSVVCWTRGVWHQCLEVLLVITDLILVRGLSPNVIVSCWFNDVQWNSSKHWSSLQRQNSAYILAILGGWLLCAKLSTATGSCLTRPVPRCIFECAEIEMNKVWTVFGRNSARWRAHTGRVDRRSKECTYEESFRDVTEMYVWYCLIGFEWFFLCLLDWQCHWRSLNFSSHGSLNCWSSCLPVWFFVLVVFGVFFLSQRCFLGNAVLTTVATSVKKHCTKLNAKHSAKDPEFQSRLRVMDIDEAWQMFPASIWWKESFQTVWRAERCESAHWTQRAQCWSCEMLLDNSINFDLQSMQSCPTLYFSLAFSLYSTSSHSLPRFCFHRTLSQRSQYCHFTLSLSFSTQSDLQQLFMMIDVKGRNQTQWTHELVCRGMMAANWKVGTSPFTCLSLDVVEVTHIYTFLHLVLVLCLVTLIYIVSSEFWHHLCHLLNVKVPGLSVVVLLAVFPEGTGQVSPEEFIQPLSRWVHESKIHGGSAGYPFEHFWTTPVSTFVKRT